MRGIREMVIFYNAHTAITHMCKYIDTHKLDTVRICTFGIWVGNNLIDIPSYTLLKLLSKHKINTEIIVGSKSPKIIEYLGSIQYDSDYIEFYISGHNHAKYIVCDDTYAMIGSANLNDSMWGEIVSCDHLKKSDYDSILYFHTELKNQSPRLSRIDSRLINPEIKKETGVVLDLW